jgi:hypothetical protein
MCSLSESEHLRPGEETLDGVTVHHHLTRVAVEYNTVCTRSIVIFGPLYDICMCLLISSRSFAACKLPIFPADVAASVECGLVSVARRAVSRSSERCLTGLASRYQVRRCTPDKNRTGLVVVHTS